MRRLFWACAWLFLTTAVILTGIASLQFFSIFAATLPKPPEPAVAISIPQTSGANGEVKGVETIVETQDARAQLVGNFLERHNSPLTPYDHYGKVFVDLADKYNIDFRLLPSIAMQESNLCKVIPEGSYNCLGFGVTSKATLTFPSFDANFERAAKDLKRYYLDKGLTTPELIMSKYTPSSDGSWASSVNQWMAEMRYDDRQLGRTLKTNADLLEYVVASPSPLPTN